MLPPAPKDHRRRAPNRAEVAEEMFQSLEAVTKAVAFQTSREASLQALGPFAMLMEELVARQSALEDFVGFVYVPKPKTDASTATAPDAEVPENTGGDKPSSGESPETAKNSDSPAPVDEPFESTAS